ncbi:Sporulation Domain-Containing Protein [Bacteroidales bacterium CF]|nr:Sporulation Domain-Containing Protein [Bacteroidales bacterium CF]
MQTGRRSGLYPKSQKRGFSVLFALLTMLSLLFSKEATCQESADYEEIIVSFSVPRIGGADVSALVKDETLYLCINDVFNFLKIKYNTDSGFNSFSGFFITEEATYNIDRTKNQILYLKKEFTLKEGDMIRTETGLYLKSNYFGEIFGLDCIFNFRALSVTLNTKIELPIIREMRQEQMRKSINQIKGVVEADTLIKRKYPILNFGNADWTLNSTQESSGAVNSRLALNIGAIVAGGETDIMLNYETDSPFSLKQQYYQWRYANNDFKAFTQVILGKIQSESISTLTSPVVGGKITNTPTTYRRSFGTYTLSDVTEPGWMVELYVNNVLVDYKKADASGFYTFDVPLIYGSTDVKLQFYGPWGEERSQEKSIEIPFNFLPKGRFEYDISAGMVEDSTRSLFSRANFDYGIARFMTLGGGVEYLSSLDSLKYIPFAKASIKIAPNLLLSGVYNYGTNFSGILNWKLKSNLQFEFNYIKYDKRQTAISTNYTEERKLLLSMPIRFKKTSFYTRLSLNQSLTETSKFTNAELIFTGTVLGVNANLTTGAQVYGKSDPRVYSNMSFSARLPGGFILTPQALYNYSSGKFENAKCGIEKRLFKKGYLNLSYDNNLNNKTSNIELGFRYDFSFAQSGINARRSGSTTTVTESATGSIIFDARSGYISGSSRSTVGTGGIILMSFLDINCNGIKDKGEPKISGLQAHISGGRIESNDRDTLVRVFDLEPYANHILSIDGVNFDNIAWQIKNKNMNVVVEPNMFRRIDIPVSVMGEASGMVYLSGRNGKSGQGRIIINFHRVDSSLVKSTLSEADGYFSFLGLKPGKYYAQIDPAQMEKVGMTASEPINFEIHSLIDGDIVDNLEFTLKKNIEDEEVVPANDTVKTSEIIMPAQQKNVVKDTLQKSEESGNNFRVQLLATKTRIEKDGVFEYIISAMPGIKIEEIKGKDGFYRYSTSGYKSKAEAETVMKEIRKNGWKDCFITSDNNREAKAMKGSFEGYKYKIQLLATIKPVEIREVFGTLLNTIKNLQIVENLESDGLYHYSAGMFRSKKAASDFVKLLNDSGWKECYILHL